MKSKTNKIKKMLAGILAAAVVAGGMPAWNGAGLPGGTSTGITAYAAETTVTWNNDDITGTYGTSFSKDGVTITAGNIDFRDKNFMQGGTFTTTLGNFTKIEVTARSLSNMGSGWTVSGGKATWTGNASSVSFSNDIYGMGMGITMVFTIELPTVDVTGVTLNKTSATLTEGETETLTATVAPNGATDKTVTWSSSDETVAAVDANGVVTAVKAGTATITATATNGTVETADDKTAECEVTVEEGVSDYVITIPATLSVTDSGWNAIGNISATGTLASGKKLTVTASSDDKFALVSGANEVAYKLANDTEKEKTYDEAAETKSWDFTALSETPATKAIGIVVEDYSEKPAGTYTDTVTFTASVRAAKTAAEAPAIAQADCTFSPTNGTSTLSNTNITTSMEYSSDNGRTWTDVTSNGSIASLAAGTVQIRVKETDEKLAGEAVSITVPQVLAINELVGPYTGDKLTCEYYAGETWEALVSRYDLIKNYNNRAAFGRDGFIYYQNGSSVPVTDLVDNTKTYEVE